MFSIIVNFALAASLELNESTLVLVVTLYILLAILITIQTFALHLHLTYLTYTFKRIKRRK